MLVEDIEQGNKICDPTKSCNSKGCENDDLAIARLFFLNCKILFLRCFEQMNIYPISTLDEHGGLRFVSSVFKDFYYSDENPESFNRTFIDSIKSVSSMSLSIERSVLFGFSFVFYL